LSQINFATLIVSFFATSAVFHFFALIAGAFERFWFIYWRQLDDASGWWRWAEYSISVHCNHFNRAVETPVHTALVLVVRRLPSWQWRSRSRSASANKTR